MSRIFLARRAMGMRRSPKELSATRSKRLQFFGHPLAHRVILRLLVEQVAIRLAERLFVQRLDRQENALPRLGLEQVMCNDADAFDAVFVQLHARVYRLA